MSSLTRSACPDWPPVLSFTRRTAVYGLVRTAVWEGRAGNRSPYPDRRPAKWLRYLVFTYRDYLGQLTLWLYGVHSLIARSECHLSPCSVAFFLSIQGIQKPPQSPPLMAPSLPIPSGIWCS